MGMHLRLKHNEEAKPIPKKIQNYMENRFMLLPEYLGLLKCFEYKDIVNEKQVKHFSIFSPARAKENHLSIKTRYDLEQHPEMLLFEGYIDMQGNAYAADRREMKKRKKAG